eukprot:UN26037
MLLKKSPAYSPVLGRFVKNRRHLKVDNQGCYLEIVYTCSHKNRADDSLNKDYFCHFINKREILKNNGPMVGFKLTYEENRTYVGISWSHLIGDARSLFWF